MAFYYETPYFRSLDPSEYTAPFSEAFGASLAQAWHEGPLNALLVKDELSRARTGRGLSERLFPGLNAAFDLARGGAPQLSRVLEKDEAEQRFDAAGLKGALKFRDGMREAEADILIREKKAELARKRTIARADDSFWTQAGLVGAGFVGSFLDPVNIAVSAIPFVGPSRTAYLLGSTGSRTATRLGIGALEGALGTAAVEPIIGSAMYDLQHDYGLANSFMNVVFGAGLGGGLHAGAGAIMDRIARRGAFFRDTGKYYDQAYASFVNDYRGLATEYGFDTSLSGFSSRLTGRLGDGFFGAKTKELFDLYTQETNAIARELGLPPPGRTPEDFMRWVDYRAGLREDVRPTERFFDRNYEAFVGFNKYHDEAAAWAKEFGIEPPPRDAKAFEAWVNKHEFIGPPDKRVADKGTPYDREFTPTYDVPQGTSAMRPIYDVAVKGPNAEPIAALPVVNSLTKFAEEIPAQMRETGMWYAANRFMQGKIADLRPFYQMAGAQKRMAEARALSVPEAQEIVRGFKAKDVRVNGQLLDGTFTYKLDFGDTGPIAILRPDGLALGDRVEWSRFGVNQFGKDHTTTIKRVEGDKAILEGWGQPVPLSELKLIEPGPAARKHTLEIEWGDLGITLSSKTAEFPSVAKLKGADKLLQVLRGDQKFEPAPITKQLEAHERPEADFLYSSIDPRERIGAVREADSILAEHNRVPDQPIPLPKAEEPTNARRGKEGGEEPTKGRRATGGEDVTRTPVEDKQIVEHDSIASQKAAQHGLTREYADMMAHMDAEIAKASEKAYFMEHYTRCLLGEI